MNAASARPKPGSEPTTAPDRNDLALAPPPTMRGVRAGVVMLAGVATVNIGNYVFHVVTARELGPERYGDVVALLTLSTLVSLPLAALQVVVSRYVARLYALDEIDTIKRLNRRLLAATTAGASAATVLLIVLTPVIKHALSISSGAAVVLTATLTLPTALTPVIWGVVQGLQRFTMLALAMGLGTIVRVGVLVCFLVIGLSTWTAITATLIGMVISVALPTVPLRDWFSRPRSADVQPTVNHGILRALAPASVALLAVTSLTQADVLAAKAVFGDTTSGIYGAASLIGRVILYLPTAIVAVLLPKVAARSASNREADDILGLSLLATLLFCVGSTVVYALAPRLIVRTAFGSTYDAAGHLLLPFGIAMTLFALLSVLMYYHLGRGQNTFAWVLGAGAVAQVVAFALFHKSPRGLIVDSIVVGTALVVAHESITNLKMVRALSRAFWKTVSSSR